MEKAVNTIDGRHRKELLKFLLVKTAAVRQGVKPGELLRVRHCYEGVNEEGLRICLYRSDIYMILGLDYVELKIEEGSSLVLFYNRRVLAETLAFARSRRWLGRLGYPVEGGLEAMLRELARRMGGEDLPHEVGIFIGYPLKDVAGFMKRLPATPVHKCPWKVYGNAVESLAMRDIYAKAERDAEMAFARADGVEEFFKMISPALAG